MSVTSLMNQNRKFRNIETKSLTKKATTEINFFVDSVDFVDPRSAKKVPANICLPKNLPYRRNTNTRTRILEQLQNAGPFLKRCNSVARRLGGSSVVFKDKRTSNIYI